MGEEKKCKYCAMMIPKEAKICPHCRKKMPMKISSLIIIAFVIFGIGTCMVITTPNSTPRTPPSGSNPTVATDDQIYREYEICMNRTKETLANDKLRGQEMVVNCFAQLKKYGDKKAKKAFVQYHEYYGF